MTSTRLPTKARIFLDFDGVMHVPGEGAPFSNNKHLHRLLDTLRAFGFAPSVVISSSWRSGRPLRDERGFDKELACDFLELPAGTVEGATPDLGAQAERSDEILSYLQNCDPCPWVAIDDRPGWIQKLGPAHALALDGSVGLCAANADACALLCLIQNSEQTNDIEPLQLFLSGLAGAQDQPGSFPATTPQLRNAIHSALDHLSETGTCPFHGQERLACLSRHALSIQNAGLENLKSFAEIWRSWPEFIQSPESAHDCLWAMDHNPELGSRLARAWLAQLDAESPEPTPYSEGASLQSALASQILSKLSPADFENLYFGWKNRLAAANPAAPLSGQCAFLALHWTGNPGCSLLPERLKADLFASRALLPEHLAERLDRIHSENVNAQQLDAWLNDTLSIGQTNPIPRKKKPGGL